MHRVLIIDDDVELCELLKEFLSSEGFATDSVHDGEAGVTAATTGDYELMVLDVMLPRLSGFEVLRRIRQGGPWPVLMLTARGEDVDRIVGLELGADDYLPKPFNPRELVARIRAILRRSQAAASGTVSREKLLVGDVELDKATYQVNCGGVPIELTNVEFELLDLLLRSAGRVITREELVKSVLGREFSPLDRSIDMHVSNLRKKLGHEVPIAGKSVERIRSIRGVGYVYAAASGDE
ncbi:MAG TPA: response regulator transcription factor [Blastocatellia bacterium]|nr:response regulator transcription factor [Blastocatellia bacterium]